MELQEPVILLIREKYKKTNFKYESIEVGNWGGVTRSSDETAVIAMERRGYVRQSN
jgi:hypothetical protein